jgi:predicted transposase YbfD/YdcC
VVTADALHTQRHHADYLVLQRGSHYLLTVKKNQPSLHNQLKALPWKHIPPAHTSTDRAYGRVEQRIVKAVTVQTGIVFPHAHQAIQITRTTCRLDSKKWTTETVYAITSLTAEQATASELASWIRGHWAIENRLRWVRDVTYDEDRSQIRTGTGLCVMASLRNLALSILRIADSSDLPRDRHDRLPLRAIIRLALQHQRHRTLTHLTRVPRRSGHLSIIHLGQSLHQTRGGSLLRQGSG